jgi:hypothetical protein
MGNRNVVKTALAVAGVLVLAVPYVEPVVCNVWDHGTAMMQCAGCDETTPPNHDGQDSCSAMPGCCAIVAALTAPSSGHLPILPVSAQQEPRPPQRLVDHIGPPLTPPPRA